MQKQQKVEIAVGAFVVIGIAALIMLAMQVSNLASLSQGGNSYTLKAKFENIGGLKARAPVMMSGVRLGQVSDVRLDSSSFEAVVSMRISQEFQNLPTDTTASIFTSGLLGEQYISLEPGGEDKKLKDGDSIALTQSAMVLEQVIGQVLFKKASGE